MVAVRGTHELVQALCGTETSWSHADDEHVNITAILRSASRVLSKPWSRLNLGWEVAGFDSHVRHGGGLRQGRCLKN